MKFDISLPLFGRGFGRQSEHQARSLVARAEETVLIAACSLKPRVAPHSYCEASSVALRRIGCPSWRPLSLLNVRIWPEAADRGCPRIGRDQGQTGRFMLGMSLSARDPLQKWAL
jgi:hypothetical protein